MSRSSEWYNEHKDLILEKYYNGESVQEICDELQCGRSLIFRKLKEWNIEKREKVVLKKRCNAIYNFYYHYFDQINDEHKAYWLGFMLADGFVNDKGISFLLKKEDQYLVELFKDDLKAEHPIKHDRYGNPFLNIKSVDLSRVLYSYGFTNHKSQYIDIEAVASNVPVDLEHHFIRGMCDGDGCIKYYRYDYLVKPQYHFGYTGTKDVCDYISSKLNITTKMQFEGNLTYTTKTRHPKLINEIFAYLYKDATIYMKRKYDTFNEIQMMTFNDYNQAVSDETKVQSSPL